MNIQTKAQNIQTVLDIENERTKFGVAKKQGEVNLLNKQKKKLKQLQ